MKFARIIKAILIITTSFNLIKNTPTRPVNLNIFVHGTVGSGTLILSFGKALYGDLHNSLAAKIAQKFRHSKTYRRYMLLPKLGFKEIDGKRLNRKLQTSNMHIYPFLNAFQQIWNNNFPSHENHFYTFGWSGTLSQTSRLEASEDLYHAILKEIEKYKSSKYFQINIFGHSHGANVGLGLAKNYEKSVNQKILHNKINLYMLGAPIQKENAHLANSNIFKEVVSVSSRGDNVQPNDRFSTSSKRSSREFDEKIIQESNGKITQIYAEYLIDGRQYLPGHAHLYIPTTKFQVPFVFALPKIISDLKMNKKASAPNFTANQRYIISYESCRPESIEIRKYRLKLDDEKIGQLSLNQKQIVEQMHEKLTNPTRQNSGIIKKIQNGLIHSFFSRKLRF